MSSSNKEKIKYLVPVLITAVLYCVVLAVKNIFPFGNRTIDYYDMAQQISAFYYHVYDMLHGTKAFFYDFYTALGVNMAMSTSGCSNLSPFNLFFLFIKRDALLESLSIFQLIKMMCMTFTMYIYLHKTHKAPYFFEVAASVGYAFSGFVLVLYITNQWMDIAALFPLLMLFYNDMIRSGKIKGYVITLTVIMISSYYLGFMILIFLFLLTGLNIMADKLYVPIRRREHMCLLELAVGTVLSIALSAFIVVPQLVQTLSSARFGNGSESKGLFSKYLDILYHVNGDYTTRWWSLLGISMAASMILIGIIRDRKNRRGVFMAVTLVLLMVLELFFESVNLMWHFGSYIQYPIRNGFIIYFVFAHLLCYYGERLFEERFEPFGYASLLLTIVGFTAFVMMYKLNLGLQLNTVFHMTSISMAGAFALYTFFFICDKGKFYSCSLGVICLEILCYSFLLFGKPDFVTGYSEEPEQEGEYIRICNQLSQEFDLEPERLYRIKNPDESLNANYGLVLRRAELSNWTHLISKDEQENAAKWGYSVQFTRLLDAGGTVFSDALLGVRDVISCVPQDEKLYEKIDTKDIVVDHLTGETKEYSLYFAKYKLPWGVALYGEDMYSGDVKDLVVLHNIMYRSMTGADTEAEQMIAGWYIKDDHQYSDMASSNVNSSKGVKSLDIDIKVEGDEAIYLTGNCQDKEDANAVIEVTDKNGTRDILVPTLKAVDNIYYPAHFNNNLIYVGSFSDEDIHIKVTIDLNEGEDFKTSVMGLDLKKMEKLCSIYKDVPEDAILDGKRKLNFTINVAELTGDTSFMIPLTYDEGWNIKVNGKRTEATSYCGLFTVIPLWEGINDVEMKYIPPSMGGGISITLLTLLSIVIYILARRARRELIESETEILSHDVEHWMTPVYLGAWTIVMLFMYIVPVLFGVYVKIFN